MKNIIKYIRVMIVVVLMILAQIYTSQHQHNQNDYPTNRTMMQMFEWYLPSDKNHWNVLASNASNLKEIGINMVWLPPAYKGQGGANDVGYGVYDTYDLGEFDQKGSIETKYGSKDDYLNCIEAYHQNNIEVICDIVLNHKMGADACEDADVYLVDSLNRQNVVLDNQHLPLVIQTKTWTAFNFENRNNQYSDFKWNKNHFTSVDYVDSNIEGSYVYLLEGKNFDNDVDNQYYNYDYLMGADVDLNNEEVINELINWGQWYQNITSCDGFRLDAVKHMCAPFYKNWLFSIRESTNKELFTVGEYWSSDLSQLKNYISNTEGSMSLFDVPLHMNFYEASYGNGYFDMGSLFNHTLTKEDSWHSVTFVDNHDTQPGQALESFVNSWFKEIAYGIILLQQKGIPCVFYGDYYGIDNNHISPVNNLSALISLRKTHAYGDEHDYYDDKDIIGFTREGYNQSTGLALIATDDKGGSKWMEVGKEHAGQTFVDSLKRNKEVMINQDGWGEFFVEDGSISVYIPSK